MVLLLGLVCMLVVQAFPEQVLAIFTNDQEVIAQAVVYLQIAAFTYVLFGFSNNYMLMARSLQSANVPFVTNVISYSLNILFDYAFIFGKFGFPQLGITGVALGTLFARLIEFGICVGHLFFINHKIDFKLRDFLLRDKQLFRDLLVYGIPSTLSETIFNLGMAAYSVVFGHLGKVAISAKAISEVISKLPQMMMTGLSAAASVLIGKTIGQGKLSEIRKQVNTFNWLIAAAVVIDMLFIFVFKGAIVNLYQITEETKTMAYAMINMAIITTIGRGYEALYVTGILVGGGDTKYIFGYTTIIMWGIVMPAAFLGAFYFHLSPAIVYLILRMDYVIKGVVGFFRTRGTKWIKEVTKTRDTAAEQE